MNFINRLKTDPVFLKSMGLSAVRIVGCVALVFGNTALAGLLLIAAEGIRLIKEVR